MTGVYWLDLILGGVLLLSVLIGVIRGFVREVFSLGTLLGAGWVAVTFGADFAPYMARWIQDAFLQQLAAGVVLFIGSAFALGMLSTLLVFLLQKIGLAGMDRTLGGLFGCLRGVLIAVVAVWVVGKTPYVEQPWWQESVARQYLAPVSAMLDRWIQDSFS